MEIQQTKTLVDSAEVEFLCSTCNQTSVTDALKFKIVDKYFGLVPVWVSHETVMKCPICLTSQHTSIPLDQLCRLSPEEIGKSFRVRLGLIPKFLVVAGWFMLCFPPIALGMLTGAWFFIPKASKGWSRGAMVGIIVSGLGTAVFAVFATIGALQEK